MGSGRRAWFRLSRRLAWLPQRAAAAAIAVATEAHRRARRRALGWLWAMHQGPRRG